MINFRAITEENFDAIMQMKRPENEGFVASNAYSLAQAWLFKDAGELAAFDGCRMTARLKEIYHRKDNMEAGLRCAWV